MKFLDNPDNKRTLLLVVLGILFSSVVSAQTLPSDSWYDGMVVSAKGDTVFGALKYNLETNSVQIQTVSNTETLEANGILMFRFVEPSTQRPKEFYSVPYEVSNGYYRPILFEVFYEAPMTLLGREKLVQETISTTDPFNPYATFPTYSSRNKLSYDFYFLDKTGDIYPFVDKSKKNLLKILNYDKTALERYIRKERLSVTNIPDLIKITTYFNAIKYGNKLD